ncbi:MAG: L-aminopeptidase/D-esterase, partial [Acidobacteria bacterium]|nr:L-aminopeptidase/D-esterase [Acidobacteriota bacterium]
DIRGQHVTAEHVLAAIAGARGGPVEEGAVGAGTGTQCFGWKGGIGTASRTVPAGGSRYVLGVLVQTNFGGVLSIDGVPVGRLLGRYAFGPSAPGPAGGDSADGSCMIIVATDAPLDARDLKRLAARMRTRMGERAPSSRTVLPSDGISPLFQAALEATEEAVYNSLFRATTMTGNGRTVDAIPLDRVRALLARRER